MKDDGFLLIDSLIALKVMLIILTFLIPTILYLNKLDYSTDDHLSFVRNLYIETKSNNSIEEILSSKNYTITGDKICEVKTNMCIKTK
ncbi:hypothetical protein [Nosocomiicoccus ampullae]|uniref:Uncharacterized protein n=1 Tax=Nosocomiicoccus ampullae TaxID=489910 RepID=A0A9Q2HFN0_9STAP|nr:hypothetical protein [Nosocomiicoccus ampullae]MBB5176424.1 hypothetical protein [Nosocomiicoccus ampullae]QYA47597.1 hypothetical protein KPF49_03915 [Nosocomiicoccus ampullae]QYA49227.1 hypothetical protein KPF52_04170 [Nosocomiicoccus ampullae]